MQTTSKSHKKNKGSLLIVDDTLQEQSVDSPFLSGKIEKATKIMSLVRAKQAERKDI